MPTRARREGRRSTGLPLLPRRRSGRLLQRDLRTAEAGFGEGDPLRPPASVGWKAKEGAKGQKLPRGKPRAERNRRAQRHRRVRGGRQWRTTDLLRNVPIVFEIERSFVKVPF